MSVDHAAVVRTPLARLRDLKRTGLTGAAGQVRELLGEIDDVLDLESAGMLLGARGPRAQLAEDGAFATTGVALLASSTVDSLPHVLTATLLRDGVLPEVRLAGFNQWRFEILAGAPNLTPFAPRVIACLLDDAAVFEQVADPLDPAEVEDRCAAFPGELATWLDACHAALGGRVVLCTVPLSAHRRDRYVDYRTTARVESAWHRMNADILALAETTTATVVLSADSLTARAGATAASDRMRHVAGHAFAPEFLGAYAHELARVAVADLGRAKKCLVLDLDHTLWGGVVGDDGVGALKLGGGYPGSAHSELQSLARDLMRQGVMLAVCSKNDEPIAREAIGTHPEMLLDEASFVGMRANWEPKPDNVASLAAELNIGTDAMVFVDDNPVERGAMRQLRPEVTTVELPADAAGYAATVAATGLFNQLALTDEDRSRTSMYRASGERTRLQSSAGSMADYLLQLGSRLTVERRDELNSVRLAQLFGKTNQFNLTGRRYTAEELAVLTESGESTFLAVRLADRFGDNGLVGAVALGRNADGSWTIENVVLSCRVFSRQVEQAVVGLILRAAAEQGAPAVHGRFVATTKNEKFAQFYPELGFATVAGESADRHFRHDLGQFAELPAWIEIGRHEGVIHV